MKCICDAMLGKLATHLRMLGIDTAYNTDIGSLSIYKCEKGPSSPLSGNGKTGDLSEEPEKPLFFTRRSIKGVAYDRCVPITSDHVREQLQEIFDLIKPFIRKDRLMSRCIRCNTPLVDAAKDEIEPVVPEYVFHHYEQFKTCPSCRRVYWKGSHAEHMMGWMKEFLPDV